MTLDFQAQWIEGLSPTDAKGTVFMCLVLGDHELAERICAAHDLIFISKATAAAIADIEKRAERGLPISDEEIADVSYAIAACSPRP
jgi:hypothetical protein